MHVGQPTILIVNREMRGHEINNFGSKRPQLTPLLENDEVNAEDYYSTTNYCKISAATKPKLVVVKVSELARYTGLIRVG